MCWIPYHSIIIAGELSIQGKQLSKGRKACKEELSKRQIDILSRLAGMQYIWLFMGWADHYLPNALRDIGLPLAFSLRMNEDNVSVQRSLRDFLDA